MDDKTEDDCPTQNCQEYTTKYSKDDVTSFQSVVDRTRVVGKLGGAIKRANV